MKNRKLVTFLLLLACLFYPSLIQAGRYVNGETRICLNGDWNFKKDSRDVGECNRWQSADFDDWQWDKMSVPGSWELTNEYSGYIGKAWYRTHFPTPQVEMDQRAFLEFEAVSMSYKVFLNGCQIADVEVGNYTERFDVTSLLNPNGDNTLAVLVDNSLLWGAYCNWGGIRRPVHLCLVHQVQIVRQEVTALPNLVKGTSVVNVKAILNNSSDKDITLSLESILQQKDGKVLVSSTQKNIQLNSQSLKEVTFQYKLSRAQTKLWDLDHPNLYTSVLVLKTNKQMLGSYADRFGIRKLELDGYQFKLNGKTLRLAGFNWVADDRTSGNTLPEWRFKEDIDRMKMLGANMARLSHRPLPQDVMDYLDEVGFLTVSEFNNWAPYLNAGSQEPREFAKKLVRQQYNHPCVVGWSVGNEMGNQTEHPQVNQYVKSVISYIKQELDSTRFVLYVSNTADFQHDDAAKYCDFIMINKYWNHVKGIDRLKELFPGKPVFISEYGDHKVNLVYDTPNKTLWSSMIVNEICDREHVFGMSVWTYNDYRSIYKSSSPLTSTPIHQNRQWGVVDSYRNKKRNYAQLRQFYSPITSLAITADQKLGQVNSTIKLVPRALKDIPSFELNGYKLIWEVRDKSNQVTGGGIISLPVVHPGDKPFNYPIRWKSDENTAFIKAALISPVGYNVADKRLDVSAPQVPNFQLLRGSREVRAVYERNGFADEYYLRYTMDGKSKSTLATIDHYIDIKSGFKVGTPVNIQLVAVNSAGETASAPQTFLPALGNALLPPVIWQIQPCSGGFFVGQSYSFSDYYYLVRYTETPEKEESWKVLQNRNLGMFQVPELENGKKYYFQIANTSQGAGKHGQTIWSEMHTVTPSATDVATGTPVLHGVIRQGNDALFVCSPACNGSLYKLAYKIGGKDQEKIVNRSDFDYVIVENVGEGDITNAKLIRIK